MRETWTGFLLVSCLRLALVHCDDPDVQYYTNKWLVHVPFGEVVAREVARINRMEYEGPDSHNDGFFRLTKTYLPSKTFDHHEELTKELNNNEFVTVAMQEAVKARSLRGVIPQNASPMKTTSSVRRTSNYYSMFPQKPAQVESHYLGAFNDTRWPEMWYFQDIRTDPSEPVLDMNIVPVYFDLRITGKGVNVIVPDDGLDWRHLDIYPKYREELSYNYISDNTDVLPDTDKSGKIRSHGTRCAGEIIMQPNNGVCGVGTAYGANIGGVKFLDSESTDAREAKVLKHALKYVDIYSNSWGPADTGMVMEHLTGLVKRSLSKGIHEARGGKGAIYVFAAGNGKADGDNCACDGYVNSIYTIVIASCDDSGHVTYYSERCASIMATAYSGSGLKKNVLTTDVSGKCTDKHTGTSAAAPLVSGIIALALSANPTLTWRDVMHLIAWTAQVAPLSDNYGWNRNHAGFFYSMDFGFGLINALYLVQQAQNWENVPEMSSCGIRMPKVQGFPVTRSQAARIVVNVDACEGLSGEVKFIEFVQLVLTMTYPKRGDIQIAMRSPQGTECHVLESRPKDFDTRGLRRWTFSVLAFWGENPKGDFVIDIYDTTGDPSNKGEILEMTLSIHGTKTPPKIYLNGARTYDNFELAGPGDKPRFFNLSSARVKQLDDHDFVPEPPVHEENNQNVQLENILRQQLMEEIERIRQIELNNLVNLEQFVETNEDTILLNDLTIPEFEEMYNEINNFGNFRNFGHFGN